LLSHKIFLSSLVVKFFYPPMAVKGVISLSPWERGRGEGKERPPLTCSRGMVDHMRLFSNKRRLSAIKVNFNDGKYSRAGGICQSGLHNHASFAGDA